MMPSATAKSQPDADPLLRVEELGVAGYLLLETDADRQGLFSIRINRQWRICFEWPDGAAKPSNIEIVDYH